MAAEGAAEGLVLYIDAGVDAAGGVYGGCRVSSCGGLLVLRCPNRGSLVEAVLSLLEEGVVEPGSLASWPCGPGGRLERVALLEPLPCPRVGGRVVVCCVGPGACLEACRGLGGPCGWVERRGRVFLAGVDLGEHVGVEALLGMLGGCGAVVEPWFYPPLRARRCWLRRCLAAAAAAGLPVG